MSIAAAGSHLILMVAGNMIGGIVSGHIIGHTKRYKTLIFFAVFLGCTCYALLVVRWRGSTAWYDTIVIVLGGLGMGISQSASFIHLAASLDAKDIAIASMSWYLSMSVGMLVSINLFNVTYQVSLSAFLKRALEGFKDADKVSHLFQLQ